jgi:hypothetical protein
VVQLPEDARSVRRGNLLDALSRGSVSHDGPDDGRRLRFAVKNLVSRIPGESNPMTATIMAYVSVIEAMRDDGTVIITFQGREVTIAQGPAFEDAWAEWSAGRADRLAEELRALDGSGNIPPSKLRAQRVLEVLARRPNRRSPRIRGRSSVTSWLVGQIEGNNPFPDETRLYHMTVERLADLGLLAYEGNAPAISVAWVTDAGMEKLFWLRWLAASDAYLAELATL